MSHPYKNLSDRAFWSTGVAGSNPYEWQDIYRKRFDIDLADRIASAGSCFAQHIGMQFTARNFNYQDFEPAPDYFPKEMRRDYGYEVFSARYGNIYTARQLLQLAQRAYGKFVPVEDFWETKGRFYDPFRPSVEPNGFASREELEASRTQHFAAVRRMFENLDVFVFTFGLTEAWVSRADGSVYPTCPGTTAGTFAADRYYFHNFTYPEIVRDMLAVMRMLRRRNANIRFLFTVSPVPLTATAADEHVLVATTYSKSVLRAVAGDLKQRHDDVDYFPSYELVTAPAMRGMAFEPNMREISVAGVGHVMSHFFSQHAPSITGLGTETHEVRKPQQPNARAGGGARRTSVAVICDEEKLELVRL